MSYLDKEAYEIAVISYDDPQCHGDQVLREELQVVVGAVPEEREEGHQFTSDVDEDGIHTYKTVG